MKILWITNSPFPEAAKTLDIKTQPAGWVYSAAKSLLDFDSNIELGIASFYGGKTYVETKAGGLSHYTIPYILREKRTDIDKIWKRINDDFSPDLVHIHGTEYTHSYSYVRACGVDNVVVSIQGLVSVYERYYLGGILRSSLRRSITFRDIVRFDTIFKQHKHMYDRGIYERKMLKEVMHVIGRTSWDKDHVWAINPDAKYHYCNETLRDVFYEKEWSIDDCEKHSIFISQAYYPIKGVHKIIKALPLILRHYPDTKVYVAGHNFFSNRGIRLQGFGNFINKLIKKNKLQDKIIFTGLLSEKQMCDRFLNSHVFVCPSSIENSPNSVGEAQLLGVPCVASYVGGTADMISHNYSGLLYRFEEVEMLASNICRLFANRDLAQKVSQNGKEEAKKRHNRSVNTSRLYSIYLDVISNR